VAGPDGRWLVRLDAHEAGGPFTLVVQDAKTTLTFTDVLVGEVWFGSGQSNMEWGIDGHPKYPKTTACDAATQALMGKGNHPQIRVSALTRDFLKTPGGGWVVMTPQNRGLMPALMSCCAIELQKKLHVPVGIIVRCESSSPSGIWLGRDAVDGDAAIQKQIAAYEKVYPRLFATYESGLAAWKRDPKKFRKPVEPPKPRMCIQYGGPNTDAYGRGYSTRIKPVIPYAIRGFVWDQGENGTGIGGAGQFEVMHALIRQWRHEWALVDLPLIYVRKNQYPKGFTEQMQRIPQTAMADNRGLLQELHPQDKAAYARRVVEQMIRLAYAKVENE
jgi:sialate O-acetylesterase